MATPSEMSAAALVPPLGLAGYQAVAQQPKWLIEAAIRTPTDLNVHHTFTGDAFRKNMYSEYMFIL